MSLKKAIQSLIKTIDETLGEDLRELEKDSMELKEEIATDKEFVLDRIRLLGYIEELEWRERIATQSLLHKFGIKKRHILFPNSSSESPYYNY